MILAGEVQRIRLLLGRSKRLVPLFLGLTSAVLAWLTYVSFPFASRDVGNLLFDQYQRWQPREYYITTSPEEVAAYEEQTGEKFPEEFLKVAPPVKVVDIDEDSLEILGQWPWPRTDLAKMTQRLAEAGALVIVFDVVFSEEDRTSPKISRRCLSITVYLPSKALS